LQVLDTDHSVYSKHVLINAAGQLQVPIKFAAQVATPWPLSSTNPAKAGGPTINSSSKGFNPTFWIAHTSDFYKAGAVKSRLMCFVQDPMPGTAVQYGWNFSRVPLVS
jgi:hypothetical protein